MAANRRKNPKKAPKKTNPKPEPALISLANRRQKPIAWLWHNRIPLGKVSLLVGDPDSGKSFLSLDLAARISRGEGVPPEPALNKPAGVLLLCADDDLDDTILPRLQAAGANLDRISVIPSYQRQPAAKADRLLSLASDLEHLEHALDQIRDCRLIVIDPVTAYLRDVDSYSHVVARQLLQKLARLATSRKAAILLISHTRKQAAPNAIHRPIGSLAFAAVSRVVLMLTTDPAIAGRRLLLPVKMTFHGSPTGRAFRIEDGRIAWEPELIPFTADEASVLAVTADPLSDPRREAKAWMIGQLKDRPVPSEVIYERARAARIPVRLLHLAKKDAKVRSVFNGQAKRWFWKMPDAWIFDPASQLVELV